MKELVVISGKGGTGKTSLVASFASLADKKILADCDVDAADLYLLLEPRTVHRESFRGSKKARIKSGHCKACGKCEEICRFDAIFYDGPGNGRVPKTFRIDSISCEGCGVCAYFCSEKAIELKDCINGEWFISDTRHGPLVYAKLGIAEENSGKLVTFIRKQARKLAEELNIDLIIIDGAPGIGCPVISSLTGVNLALIVTEPTLSGWHDLKRVAELTNYFKIPAVVCINKYDINPDLALKIEIDAKEMGLKVLDKIKYDSAVTRAQIMKVSVVEYTAGAITQSIKSLWRHVVYELG